MVSHKNAKKARKPIETTLGKAPIKPQENEPDISHLRKPIETSISGLQQVFSVLENATSEVRTLLMYECDIMYECRICRTIFRSLANFILHKRSYCQDKFSPLGCVNNSNNNNNENDTLKILEVSPPKREKIEHSKLEKVIQQLHEIETVQEASKRFLTVDLSEPGNEPIRTIDDRERKTSNFNNMVLEKIDSNDSGIFQTLVESSSNSPDSGDTKYNESMKSEVMENHKKIENDVPVLDPEGKICGYTSSKRHQKTLFPKSEFKCPECNNRFATQKSLTNHIKCVHNPSRIIYICPTCKDSFANPWCVYRHLLKVHRMSNKQVRRMREQVHNSWIRRGDESSLMKKKPEVNPTAGDSENQWINDIEGDKDFQMCAGCGKHFERKAALHSHSQMCAKRLEVCHNIRENAKKKGEEEATERAKLDKMASDKIVLKGASKRKGKNVCGYRKKRPSLLDCEDKTTNLVSLKPEQTKPDDDDDRVSTKSDTGLHGAEENNTKGLELKPLDIPFAKRTSKDLFIDLHNDPDVLSPSPTSSSQVMSRSSLSEDAAYLNISDDSLTSPLNDTAIIKDEKPAIEEVDPLSLDSVNSNESVCIISDSNDDPLLNNKSDLFSDKVTFDMFVKKVSSVKPFRKRKRNEDLLKCSDKEDDVIFVSETSHSPENGFAGFSNEETNRAPFSIDFSNLSYNNPLKSKAVKSEPLPKDTNFVPQATPYMDPDKLMCIPCGLTFKAYSLLLWHMSAHFSWFRFQCSKCSFISFNKYDCLSHAQNNHNLEENVASRCILPLPSWKTVLMSHEFRLLKDCHELKGKHTDEKIGFEESHHCENNDTVLEPDSKLVGEIFTDAHPISDMNLDKDIIKERNDTILDGIDIQETARDSQKLPDPVELAIPADVSEIFKTFTFEEAPLSPDETFETLDHHADESNDDWGLSKLCRNACECEELTKTSQDPKDDMVSLNIRPSRTRTKVKQDDFVYYDNDIKDALKMLDIFRSSSQKSRSDGVVAIKSKVPTAQKRKS